MPHVRDTRWPDGPSSGSHQVEQKGTHTKGEVHGVRHWSPSGQGDCLEEVTSEVLTTWSEVVPRQREGQVQRPCGHHGVLAQEAGGLNDWEGPGRSSQPKARQYSSGARGPGLLAGGLHFRG